jgi:hypothetical protein
MVGDSLYLECRGDPVLLTIADRPGVDPAESRPVHSFTVAVGHDDFLGERGSRVQTMLAGFRTASEAATTFLEWLRIDLAHTWLGVRPQLAAPVELVDIGAEGSRSLQASDWPLGTLLPSAKLLDRELAEAIAGRVSGGRPVPLEESLLAEAYYLIWPDISADARRAVLSAAAAAEVAVKGRLLVRATPSSQGLLELQIDRPPTAELYDSVAKAVFDRSLREEDGPLFTRLDRLFRERERITHPAEKRMITGQAARAFVDTAKAAIDWLGSV